jgi:sirohydrochlorin cobaltochelatase
VVLVGHGAVPKDYPRSRVRRLLTLEAERLASGAPISDEERELDRELRDHPRTPETDPYKAGLECLAYALWQRLSDQRLYVAYNEFCAPSVPDAVQQAIDAGAHEVILLSSMMTPGGSHSELEIPELVEELSRVHPEVPIRYAWPFDVGAIADLMAGQVACFTQRRTAAE